jgi:hypothetical protein
VRESNRALITKMDTPKAVLAKVEAADRIPWRDYDRLVTTD